MEIKSHFKTMREQAPHISESINVLCDNLSKVAQVGEWADLMGYGNSKKFSRRFLNHYSVRPCKILISIRLKSIYRQLQNTSKSNYEIARLHSLPDEKALNKFVNYHFGCSPSQLKVMTEKSFKTEMEKYCSATE